MFAGDRRFFCKQECEESILIETTSDRDENGRYKVEYSKTFYLSYPVLYVTITRLSKSDAGPYVCGLGKPLFPDSQEDFELVVKDGNLLYVGFALLMMMAVLLVFGLLFRATRYKEYLLKAEYSRGRYTDLNGDNDRAPAAGSQNQATEDSNTTTLLHSVPTDASSDANYSEVNNKQASPPL
ncbi:hypothetical protein D5F01_LYC07758 [Larimichthys crocea]|uniref:Immunoglobulin V-set domain-containing protein n=1 Tax=Larimichthys crocea TaxID=215358 RepID=A0A6G0IN11_LARCR|nr:hypothetical protein D5F01_LYC07758 [Larimichthys crocea]